MTQTRTFSGVPGDSQCECHDKGCTAEMHTEAKRCGQLATVILYRVDMEDQTGTAFCEGCADDAAMSGVFAYQAELDVVCDADCDC